MTLRARPVARRRGRAGWDSGDRRNSLINAGFVLAIGISILILVGYAAWTWYDSHFGTAATVNGVAINKDQVRNRFEIEGFRLAYIESRITNLVNRGRISESDGNQQKQFIEQRRQQLASLALERLVDNLLMAKLAADKGISVTDADVDEQLKGEATTNEMRHVWMIEVEPDPDPDTGDIGEKEKREAQTKAQQALGRLNRGDRWEDVAREVDTSGLREQAGDLGWLQEESGYDEAFMTAVFDAEINKPTAVIAGDDDVYRIGRYTEQAPEEVDTTFDSQIEQAGIKLEDYRAAARGDAIREKLSDRIVADLKQPGKQRHVLEIYLPEPAGAGVGAERGVKVRWIVYAPKDSTKDAKDVPADDPAWAKAKADAEAAYANLKAHPDQFDATARKESDEASARDTGGKQPWIYPTTQIDQPVKDAVLADGLKDGQLLAPLKGDLGWYVIQFMRNEGDGDAKFLEALKGKITSVPTFRQAARDHSEGEEAGKGGDIGWIAPGQLGDELDKAILETAIGSTSDVITVQNDGSYLIRVLAEETRPPTDEQIEIFEDNGFSYWYTKEKEKATITYDIDTSTTG